MADPSPTRLEKAVQRTDGLLLLVERSKQTNPGGRMNPVGRLEEVGL